MYCPSCGTEIDDSNNFCPSCGKELPESNSTPEKTDNTASNIPDQVAEDVETGTDEPVDPLAAIQPANKHFKRWSYLSYIMYILTYLGVFIGIVAGRAMGPSGGGNAAMAIIFFVIFGILAGSGFYRHSYGIYHPAPTKFTFWAGLVGYGILSVIGLFAGFFPALLFAPGLYWAYMGGKANGLL